MPLSWANFVEASKSVMSRYSRTRGRFCSQPRPAADEIIPMADPFGIMSPSTSRSIMCRCPMKLMRSIPGVPSATPAQENRACTGPPHSSTAASIDALSERSSLIALTPSRVTSARSMTTTSAPASFTSSAVAAPMPVAPPTTTARLPSYLNASNRPISLLFSSRTNRQGLPSPHRRGAGHLGVVPVDFPFREALEHFIEGHPTLEAGQGGAQAEVEAVAEAQVVADLAVDVE